MTGLKHSLTLLSAAVLAGCSMMTDTQTRHAGQTVVNAKKLTYYADWPKIQSQVKRDPVIESKVSALVAQMTLEEKVGQMIQPNLSQVTPAEAKQYKLGSLLNGGGSWPNKNKHASAQDWANLADQYWTALDDAYADRGFKIPFMWATDAVHGHNNVFGATVFPHNIGLGAANDPDLIYRIGQVTAREVAATGLDWTFAPTVAAPRNDRWGRVYEGYSEDPEIIFNYAGKMVEGLQGGSAGLKSDTQVISSVKHWVGDGGTQNGIDRGKAFATEEELINLHAAGYFSGLSAGAQVVMSSFNSWHNDANHDASESAKYNKKLHASEYLINDVLKGKMGFDGLVITDWNGHNEVNGCTSKSCPAAVNAGNDIFMVTARADWQAFYRNVIKQVNDGTIAMSRIDDAVTRILRVKMRAGLWEKPKPTERSLVGRTAALGVTAHRQLAREAVTKSLVLLKNKDNVLPLSTTQKVFLAGSAAHNLQKQTGGWSLTWQGTENTLADFPGATTLKMALESQLGVANVITDESAISHDMVAIVAIGEDPYAEVMGDIKDHQTLAYAKLKDSYAKDLATIKDLKARGMKVVTVMMSGRPLYVNEEINHSDAFIAAWLPGTEAGGISDALYRVNGANFTGRLSYSWPNTPCSTAINRVPKHMPNYVTPKHEQALEGDHAPLFEYGYGLSYGAKNTASADLDELLVSTRGFGCGQTEADTAVATQPLEVYGKASGGEFGLNLSGEANSWKAIPVSIQSATDQGGVMTRPLNYQSQYDAVSVDFKGKSPAQIYAQYLDQSGRNQTRYLNAEATLQFDIKVHQQPTAKLMLAQHCEYPCLGQIALNKLLPAVSNQWTTLKVPLKCFAQKGMNYRKLNTPFLLFTTGKARFDVANVRIVPKSLDAATNAVKCPE
ncbi:glycoside hydrolase family 3 protein [Leucothrix sargassi]|nr:glycoside hydrolase family 3 protein [Leucothrix sargassi]